LEAVYKYFVIILILADAFAMMACIRYALRHKSTYALPLVGWYTSRFLSLLLPVSIRLSLGWKTEQIMSFSVMFEGLMMFLFFLILIKPKNRLIMLLFVLPFTVFVIEFYLLEHFYDIMYVSHVVYYVFVTGLLIWLISSVKVERHLIYFLNINVVYHVIVFVNMLSLPFVSHSKAVASIVYPLYWLIYLTYDLLCARFFVKASKLDSMSA
jgi:hypothetical protein